MTMPPGTEESSGKLERLLEGGRRHLSRGGWQEARASFEAALVVKESPEAFEGLSWSAWWTDDSTTVFECRERAFHLYRQADRPASAARMAIWLAVDHLDFNGFVAVARGWLRRARRFLDVLETQPEHGWLSFQEGYLAYVTGDTERATELAVEAANAGRALDVPDLEMLGLGLHGSILVACGKVGPGMALLDEAAATALSEPSTVPISSAWTCCFLVTACEQIGDYRRAYEWCGQIETFAHRYASRYMFGFCRSHYGLLHLRAGRWREAEDQLVEAVEAYTQSRPPSAPYALAALAELRCRQGQLDEAERLLDEAGAGREALLGRGRLALIRGEALRAAELAQRSLRHIPRDRVMDRARGLDVLARAHVARKDFSAASSALEELRAVQQTADTLPLHAAVDLVGGMIAASSGHHTEARQLLEDACDRYEATGCPFEAAEARIQLSRSLAALHRREAAVREAEAARDRMAELGAHLEARRAQRVLEAVADSRVDAASDAPLPQLTSREREILCIVAEGLTNRQIADSLCISEHTVHHHVTNILRKLDLSSRAAAAALAARSGLLDDTAP